MQWSKRTINILFLIAFCVIFAVACLNIFSETLYVGLLFVPLLLFGLFLLTRDYAFQKGRKMWVLWGVLQVTSFVIMLFVAFQLEVDFSWDWGGLVKTAAHYTQTGQIDSLEYYARYPNNSFWVLCLILLFNLVKLFYPAAQLDTYKAVSMVFSCVLVQVMILLLFLTAKIIWNEKKAFLTGGAALLCVPLYVYAMYAYTDTAGMVVVAACCFVYAKYKKGKETFRYPLLLGILSAFVFQIKVMAFIVCIGILIDFLLTRKERKQKIFHGVTLVSSFVIVLFCLKAVTGMVLPVSDQLSDAKQFPPMHWVMMGLTGEGGYNQEDVAYTLSFDSYKEKSDADLRKIKERVDTHGFMGLVNHVVNKKLKSVWGHGSLASEFYCNRLPLHSDGFLYQLFAYGGKYHIFSTVYSNVYYAILLLGILLAGVLTRKKEFSIFSFVGKVCTLGIIVFLAVWESNSRYLVVFVPVLFLVSMDGWFALRTLFLTKKSHSGSVH